MKIIAVLMKIFTIYLSATPPSVGGACAARRNLQNLGFASIILFVVY